MGLRRPTSLGESLQCNYAPTSGLPIQVYGIDYIVIPPTHLIVIPFFTSLVTDFLGVSSSLFH